MSRPKIRFSVVTDDLKGSLDFYQDVLKLKMRPFSNGILMFSFGEAEFEVCLRSEAMDLLEGTFSSGPTSNLMVSMVVDGSSELNFMHQSLADANIEMKYSSNKPFIFWFTDLNGLKWMIESSDGKGNINVQRKANVT